MWWLSDGIRSVKKFGANCSHEEERIQWSKQYREEEMVGIQLLQHIRGLEDRQNLPHIQQEGSLIQARVEGSQSRLITVQQQEYEVKLVELHQRHWKHHQVMQELVRRKPLGASIREWEIRRRRRRGGFSLEWWDGVESCVIGGGCCARGCGCCQKALATYPDPYNTSSMRRFHAHCTVGYRCCAGVKGLIKESETSVPPTDNRVHSESSTLQAENGEVPENSTSVATNSEDFPSLMAVFMMLGKEKSGPRPAWSENEGNSLAK